MSHPVLALPPSLSSGRGGMVDPGRGLPFILGHIHAVGTRRFEAGGEVSEKHVYKLCIRVKCKQSREMERS